MEKTKSEYAQEADSLESKPAEVPLPLWKPDDFFKQRNSHRSRLFKFALWMSISSFLFLIGVVIAQTYFRATINPTFEVISDQGLQIVAVAIFGQIFGVVYVIAHALWSNHEFELMTNGKK